jgi:hypothetical protein
MFCASSAASYAEVEGADWNHSRKTDCSIIAQYECRADYCRVMGTAALLVSGADLRT